MRIDRTTRRRVRRAESPGGREKVDLTSMTDVVFLLLIFFMVATQFRADEGSLDSWLPRDRGTGSEGSPVPCFDCRITLFREGDEIVAWADQSRVPRRLESDLGEADPFQEFAKDDGIRAQADQEAAMGLTGPDRRVIEEHLRNRLGAWMGASPRGMPVVLDFAGDVPSAYPMAIVDLCRKLRIEEIRFAVPGASE